MYCNRANGTFQLKQAMNYKPYIEYFRQLCTDHIALSHADASGQSVFQVISQAQAVGDFRSESDTDGYLFRLIEPQWGLSSLSRDMLGGFILAKRFSHREQVDDGTTLHEIDRIGYQFAWRMVQDSLNGRPFLNYSIRELSDLQFKALPKSMLADGYIGRLFTFRFACPLDISDAMIIHCWKSKTN
jgi:hypothetical protein